MEQYALDIQEDAFKWLLANRSANLGDCAQSCRWAYNVYVEENNNPGNLMPVEYDEKEHTYFLRKTYV